MPFPDTGKSETNKAMCDPQVGDRFSEMLSFWMYVIGREGNIITFIEGLPPCELPKDGYIGKLPLKQFQARYAYGTIPGYSIRLVDRGNDVEGWEQAAEHKIELDEYCPCCGKKTRKAKCS